MSIIHTLDRLRWNEDLFGVVKARVKFAQEEGELETARSDITGDERVAWIGYSLDPHAFILFYEARPRIMWVDMLLVEQHRRHAGLGTALMKHVFGIARASGYSHVELGTQVMNTNARRLYEKLDFDERAIFYRLDLNTPEPPFSPPLASGQDDMPF